jgi:hypothetical protein
MKIFKGQDDLKKFLKDPHRRPTSALHSFPSIYPIVITSRLHQRPGENLFHPTFSAPLQHNRAIAAKVALHAQSSNRFYLSGQSIRFASIAS